MQIAYLINQYPKVSHSFIRREILALERLGFEITRIALRGWDEKLVDDEDILERISWASNARKSLSVLDGNWQGSRHCDFGAGSMIVGACERATRNLLGSVSARDRYSGYFDDDSAIMPPLC